MKVTLIDARTNKVLGECNTNQVATIDMVVNAIGGDILDPQAPHDPDYRIAGKNYWSSDLIINID